MQIVKIEDIPTGDFFTPKEDLMKLYAFAQSMIILCEEKKGMGLSASQVGFPWKLFVYWSNYPSANKQFDCLIDCEYEPISSSKKEISIEGCLSLDGHFKLERYTPVRVFGKKLKQQEHSLVLEEIDQVFSGVIAVVLQHEIDHQHGRNKMIDNIGERVYLS